MSDLTGLLLTDGTFCEWYFKRVPQLRALKKMGVPVSKGPLGRYKIGDFNYPRIQTGAFDGNFLVRTDEFDTFVKQVAGTGVAEKLKNPWKVLKILLSRVKK